MDTNSKMYIDKTKFDKLSNDKIQELYKSVYYTLKTNGIEINDIHQEFYNESINDYDVEGLTDILDILKELLEINKTKSYFLMVNNKIKVSYISDIIQPFEKYVLANGVINHVKMQNEIEYYFSTDFSALTTLNNKINELW